jgi:hypothetical protein
MISVVDIGRLVVVQTEECRLFFCKEHFNLFHKLGPMYSRVEE